MIKVKDVRAADCLHSYCYNCRFDSEGNIYCDCGKYNEELQALYAKNPKQYAEAFVPTRS